MVCGHSEIKRELSVGRNYDVTGRNFLLAGGGSDPHILFDFLQVDDSRQKYQINFSLPSLVGQSDFSFAICMSTVIVPVVKYHIT